MSSPVGHCVDKPEYRGDRPVHFVQGSRETVRKRTFTRWINKVLIKCDPPLRVDDLFTDVQDGRILMALLEELSGCKMLCRFNPSTHSIFRLSNIAKVLDFLEDRNMRVVNIDAADVVDGRPSVVLKLTWYIIVYFQLKEVTGNLARRYSSVTSLISLSESSESLACDLPVPASNEYNNTLSSNWKRASHQPKYNGRAIMALLNWVQCCTALYGVEVYDFSKSWRNGLAFLALVKCARPELVDMKAALNSSTRNNFTAAFRIAQHSLGIPPLLDPEDVMVHSPDEQSIITYIAQFLECFPVNREHNVSTLSLVQEAHSVEDQKMSLSALEHRRDLNSCCEVRQMETASFYQSSTECSSILCNMKKSSFQNGQSYHSSTEGHCRATLAHEKRHIVCVKEEEPLILSSEEGLSALDPDEEDAYRYILELGQEQSEIHNRSDFEYPTLSDIISTPKYNCSLQDDKVDLHQGNEQYCIIKNNDYPSLKNNVQSHWQLLSENNENPEECMSESKVWYTNNIQFYHRHSKKGTDSKLCAFRCSLNSKDIPEFETPTVSLSNKGRSDISSKTSSFKEKDFQNNQLSHITSNGSLSMVKSLKVFHAEDDCQDYIFMRKSVEDEISPQQESFTHQTRFSLVADETEKELASNLASDVYETLCPDIIYSESEMLQRIFFLWIVVYCAFIVRQLEFWEFSFA